MKKLIIAAAIVIASVASQAATIWWQNGCGAYDPAGQGGEFEGGAVYLMNGDATVAQAFIDTLITSTDLANDFASATAGKLATLSYGEEYSTDISSAVTPGAFYDLFVVAVDAANNGFMVSEIQSAEIIQVGDTDIYFDAMGSYEVPFAAGVTTYDSTMGGWYTAVPEPTSGLLLLLGVAGLALKRRRA